MKLRRILPVAISLLALCPFGAFAQGPDGSDINKAIPIYFGQIVTDTIDSNVKQWDVYSLTLARGQQVNVTAKSSATNPNWELCLSSPSVKTVIGSINNSCYYDPAMVAYSASTANTVTYQVAAAGVYYLIVHARSTGINFQLQVTAQGTPIAVPNPPTAGCLSGPVNYITYSLQLIAAGLADEISIGGTKVNATSVVKPPLYTEIVSRLENALRFKLNVNACYDASGNIFQISLVQP